MASGRGLTQIYGPGEIFITPTDLTGTSGSGLGHTEGGCTLIPGFATGVLKSDERGAELLKEVYAGCDWIFVATLIQWDAAQRSVLFPGFNISGGVNYGNSVILGTEITPVKMLWVPDDKTVIPSVYFRKAVPHIEATARIRLALGDSPKPAGFPVVFRNASAQDSTPATSVQVELLANITL